jgi:serine/threonine protein kinase
VEREPPYIDVAPGRAAFLIAVNDPPSLKAPQKYSKELNHFVQSCLQKQPEHRQTAEELLFQHPFMYKACSRDQFQAYLKKWKKFYDKNYRG